MKFKFCLLLLGYIFCIASVAAQQTVIRLGVVAGGTLSWELAALDNDKRADTAEFDIVSIPLANPQAGKIAIQTDAVDIVISDWPWVASQRSEGSDLTFYPYSNTSGALIVPTDGSINALADLKDKKLGIAGGELDKNWLLLQALGRQQGIDLQSSVEKVYGAPPLLNQQLASQRVDALLTYWHFAAKLETQGYRQLIDGETIQRNLGADRDVPALGYVFKRAWAERHAEALRKFLDTARIAKNRLCDDDSAWQKIASLTETNDLTAQQQLRRRYCDGRISTWGQAELQAAEKLFGLLQQASRNKLTGDAQQLPAGTFWQLN